MPQALLPIFPSDATQINELVSCAKRDGTVFYFNGALPVFSHSEGDRASFKMFASQLVVHGSCSQSEIVHALGISAISMKRYVKQYRQGGAASFFKSRKARQPRVLTPMALQKSPGTLSTGPRNKRCGAAIGD
jgi:hypothetical protein